MSSRGLSPFFLSRFAGIAPVLIKHRAAMRLDIVAKMRDRPNAFMRKLVRQPRPILQRAVADDRTRYRQYLIESPRIAGLNRLTTY